MITRETSRLAFKKILKTRSKLSRMVFERLVEAEPNGMTSDEMVVEFQILKGVITVQPRLTELHQKGLIYRTKRTRASRTGYPCTVYRVRKKPRPIKPLFCPTCGLKISKKRAKLAGIR